MNRFKVGQTILCINKSGWCDEITGVNENGPKYNEECEVSGYDEDGYPNFVCLVGYGACNGFRDDQFEPLVSSMEIYQQLNEIAVNKQL